MPSLRRLTEHALKHALITREHAPPQTRHPRIGQTRLGRPVHRRLCDLAAGPGSSRLCAAHSACVSCEWDDSRLSTAHEARSVDGRHYAQPHMQFCAWSADKSLQMLHAAPQSSGAGWDALQAQSRLCISHTTSCATAAHMGHARTARAGLLRSTATAQVPASCSFRGSPV